LAAEALILIPNFIASSRRVFCRPVSQPRRSFSYAIGFLPCRPTKSLAALDANKLYINMRKHKI